MLASKSFGLSYHRRLLGRSYLQLSGDNQARSTERQPWQWLKFYLWVHRINPLLLVLRDWTQSRTTRRPWRYRAQHNITITINSMTNKRIATQCIIQWGLSTDIFCVQVNTKLERQSCRQRQLICTSYVPHAGGKSITWIYDSLVTPVICSEIA